VPTGLRAADVKTLVQIGSVPEGPWANSEVRPGWRHPAVARRGRVVEFARGGVELNAFLYMHGCMACCMSTTPAPTETPIYNLEDALGP